MVTKANAMTQAAGSPKHLWAAAQEAATYLANRTSTRGLKHSTATPYELWHGRKPSVKHLRVWGCVVYTHIHKADRGDSKMGARADACAFIGYSPSNHLYICYNSRRKKPFLTRDVLFDETRMYFRCNFLDSEKEIVQIPLEINSGHESDASSVHV